MKFKHWDIVVDTYELKHKQNLLRYQVHINVNKRVLGVIKSHSFMLTNLNSGGTSMIDQESLELKYELESVAKRIYPEGFI